MNITEFCTLKVLVLDFRVVFFPPFPLNNTLSSFRGFPGGSDVKEYACHAGDSGLIWGQEDPLEEGMAACSSILAWRSPRTGEPGWLQSMESWRVRHDWAANIFLSFYFVLEYRQLTMLWWFQVDSKGTQPYIYKHPFSPKLPSKLGCHIILSRLLCCAVGPCWIILLLLTKLPVTALERNRQLSWFHLTVHCSWTHRPWVWEQLSYTGRASLVSQRVKDLPAVWENRVPSLGWEDPLGKEMTLQYYCRENSMDTTVHGVAKSQTWLSH